MNKLFYSSRIWLIAVFSFPVLLVLFLRCTSDQITNKERAISDSLAKARIKADSFALLKQKEEYAALRNLKAKKTVSVSDKTITVIQNAGTTKELKYEYDFGSYNTYWRVKPAERDETFLNIRIKLSSKSKWNKGGGDFLPNLNIFRVDTLNKTYFIETMTYQLYQEPDRNYAVLEQIFDYKESEVFVCWLSLKTPINGKYVISVNSGDKIDFDVNTVIGIIKAK